MVEIRLPGLKLFNGFRTLKSFMPKPGGKMLFVVITICGEERKTRFWERKRKGDFSCLEPYCLYLEADYGKDLFQRRKYMGMLFYNYTAILNCKCTPN